MRKNKVDIITLGCAKNLVDSEQLLIQFQANGYTVAHDPKRVNGEIVVVNTCGFIGDAQEESIQVILELEEAKKRGQIGKLFVMGCLSERFMKDLQLEIPGVDRDYGRFNWKNLLNDLGKAYHDELAYDRILTTPAHYAYLKIAEGCNRTCSFCVIPTITGKYQSRPMDDIVKEAQLLVAKGVKELQVVAQDLTYYGMDLYQQASLPELAERLSDIQGLAWIRLHYGYPAHFPLDLLRVMRERPNICKYLDIALQHISDRMLEKMRRRINSRETYQLLKQIRQEVPGIHLRTTLMVGHPGETDDDFTELIAFVKEMRFERLGAFTYSHEAGTYASLNYEDEVPDAVKKQRIGILMHVQKTISEEENSKKVGKTFQTIIDRKEGDFYIGRTAFDSPEIDPEVLIMSDKQLQIGTFYDVLMEKTDMYDLVGKVALIS
jgi:ribosomal protein S12 methylthiotransferase